MTGVWAQCDNLKNRNVFSFEEKKYDLSADK